MSHAPNHPFTSDWPECPSRLPVVAAAWHRPTARVGEQATSKRAGLHSFQTPNAQRAGAATEPGDFVVTYFSELIAARLSVGRPDEGRRGTL